MFTLQKSKHHSILSLLVGYYLVNVTPERFREQSAKLDSAMKGAIEIKKNLTINMGTFQNQVDGEVWRSIQFQVSQSWSRFLSKQEASFYNFLVGNDWLFNTQKNIILNFLKDWWYNREDTQSPTFSSEAIPPPPPALTSDVPRDLCPVCRRGLGQGDTLAPVSGLVFCYPCIVTHVRWEHFRPAVRWQLKV